MRRKTETDEYLEVVWYMRESGRSSLEALKAELGDHYRAEPLEELERTGMIDVDREAVSLTEAGVEYTGRLIRSHRLAERLVHDVLGAPYEEGACEFEHIVNSDLVDSICTLLGHPRECPHGMPIPEGECCRRQRHTVESPVLPLTRLGVGESAQIAYVNAENDRQLHKLENLLLIPGNTVKLHQRAPSFVIECENSTIALDERMAEAISVWAPSATVEGPRGRRGRRRGLRHGVREGEE